MITNRWIAMDAVHHERLAQPTVGYQLPQRVVLGVEAPHEAHLDELLAEHSLLLHDRVRGVDVGRQWLLAQHRNAPIQARIELFRVGRTRAGDEHRIHLWVVDGGHRIGLNACPDSFRNLCRLVGEEVVDHGDRGAAHSLAQCIRVEGTHHADAEYGDSQVIAHWCLPNSMVALLQELR